MDSPVMHGKNRLVGLAAVVALAGVLLLASGCRLVGSGTLGYMTPADEPAAMSGSVATIQVFRAAPGDAWPPAGKVALTVRADYIPPLKEHPGEAVGFHGDDLELAFGPHSVKEGSELMTCSSVESAPQNGYVQVYAYGLIGRLPAGDDRAISEVFLLDETLLPHGEVPWVIVSPEQDYSPWYQMVRVIRCGTMTIKP